MKSAAAAAISGGVIGGIVGGGIDLLIQGLTGDGKIEWAQVMESALDGAKTGALEGALLAMSPTAFYCYEVEQALQQAVELKYTLLDPTVPTWQKYIAAVGFVTSALPLISPRLAKKMSDALQKFCFPAGTEVAAEDGNKPIEDIAVGDLVWAQSDQTGQVSLKRVKQLFVNVAASLVVITAGAETIEATDVHPFWVANQGWKAAGQVQVGDELWTRSGERVKVTEIGHKKGQFTVYNFEVEDAHTYFAGERLFLTHNASCVKPNVTKKGNLITRVETDILPGNLYGGTATTKAARDAMFPGDDAGHIIGKLLGGKGGVTSDNIFSQNPHINRGEFAQHEGWVADRVRAGRKVKVDVELHYQPGSTRVDSITYDTYVDGVLFRKTFGN